MSGTEPTHAAAPLRLVIQQPALPKYRVPLFRDLARRPGMDLHVYYADVPGAPPSVAAEGFAATCVPMWRGQLLGHPLYWHRPQWQYATRATTDVLLLSWDLHYLSLLPALLRARWHCVPVVLWGHGYSKREAAWRRLPRRWVTKLATALLFYNTAAARAYEAAGVDPRRLFVALNALDQAPIRAARQKWLADPAALAAFRQEHGLDRGPVVLFVSRLDAANRVDLLLDAAARLGEELPTLQVAIIGKGEGEAALRDQARRLGLTQRVRLLGAVYEEEKLAPWFLSAQVFCYPANIGLSLLHAFGYGLPVVTSDRVTAQNPEIEALRDGENGLLYADGDAGALAAALRRLLSDPALRARLGAAALATVTEGFTLSRLVDGMEAAFRYAGRTRRGPR